MRTILDCTDKDSEAERGLAVWAKAGKLKVVEDGLDALVQAPAGLTGLLAGGNRGKRMIRVGSDPP